MTEICLHRNSFTNENEFKSVKYEIYYTRYSYMALHSHYDMINDYVNENENKSLF